eukprot:m51a1_g4178 hypothetical protein (391) ;mRNA; f:351513-352900
MLSYDFYDFAGWIADCPAGESGGHRASTTASFALLSFAALCLALAVAARYNSIVLYERRVRTPGISNALWACFFGCMAVAQACDAAYMATGARSAVAAEVLAAVALGFRGAAVLFASLSLAHQIRFRSSPMSGVGGEGAASVVVDPGINSTPPSVVVSPRSPPPYPSAGAASSLSAIVDGAAPSLLPTRPPKRDSMHSPAVISTSPRSGSMSSYSESSEALLGGGVPTRVVPASALLRPSAAEVVCSLLFVLFLVCVLLEGTVLHSLWWSYIPFLASVALQLVPIPVMCLVICCQKRSVGPRLGSKLALVVGVLAQLAVAAPVQTWGYVLPSRCLYQSFLSTFDLAALGFTATMYGAYFAFLAREYERHKAECMYQFIRHTREPLDYRQF